LAPELYRLRHIRDEHLPKWFVRLYYRISPPLARQVSRHELARRYIRALIRLALRVL
jgi:hypothetical protein